MVNSTTTLLKIIAFPVAFVIAGVIIGAITFIFSAASFQGFYVNLAFALTGIGVTILITVFVIDRLLKYRREQQWAKVRNVTLNAIKEHLCDIASEFSLVADVGWHDIDGIQEGRNHLNSATPRAFETFAKVLDERGRRDFGNDAASDVVVKWYKMILWDLNQIQLVLTPLAITSSSDQKLIDALIEFDKAHREFCRGIRIHKLSYSQDAWPAMVRLIKSSGNLYAAIFNNLSETPIATTDYNSYFDAAWPGHAIVVQPFTKETNDRGEAVYKRITRNASLPEGDATTTVIELMPSQAEAKQLYDQTVAQQLSAGFAAQPNAAASYKAAFPYITEVWVGQQSSGQMFYVFYYNDLQVYPSWLLVTDAASVGV